MSVPKVAHRRSGRRVSPRLAIGTAVALWGLGAGPASAVLLDSFVWGSNNAAYNVFAGTCPNVGGTQCGQSGSAPSSGYATTVARSQGAGTFGSGTIFSWGTDSAADAGFNSRLSWVNDGAAFTLERIVLKANGPVGTGLPDYSEGTPPIPTSKGTGASPAWEWATKAFNTAVSEAMVKITVAGGAAATNNVFSGYPLGADWFNTPNADTRQTPVNFLKDYVLSGLVIDPSQVIDIRFFESLWNARGATPAEGRPDLQYAPMTIEIWGTPMDVPLPGSLVLVIIGAAALRFASRPVT